MEKGTAPIRAIAVTLGAVLTLVAGLSLATAAGAQTVAPFAGEHAGFTRVVLLLPPGSGWQLSPEGRSRSLTLDEPALRFDLAGLFQRIPRRRLAEASAEGAVLRLELACDCPVRAWEERPGLVILDISDAPQPAGPNPVTPLAPPARPLLPPPAIPARPDPIASGRAAGTALARSLPMAASQPEAPRTVDPRIATLARDLGHALASAMGQGILEPNVEGFSAGAGLLDDIPQPEMPQNMRVTTVLDRNSPAAPQSSAANCAGSEVLDAMLVHDASRFSEEHGRLARSLYGEFDQPDPGVLLDLTALYLSAGFGAEARALVENARSPIAGRDYVLGMADVLEGRASNSRLRLAQAVDCGGAVSVLAVLAGAPTARVLPLADRIALTFINQNATIRDLLGLDLAGALADAGALDAARIVADALRRSEWVRPEEVALVEARLDRARGLPVDAAARLDHEGGQDRATIQTRLDLALETQTGLEQAYLANAEALAASARGDGSGPELLASVVRVHARSGALPDAFAALDRLESWMTDTGANRQLLGDLRDEVWSALAGNGTDFGLVEAVLSREDWREAALRDDTKRALARRLLDLGFATPIDALLGPLDEPVDRLLRARAALARGDAAGALQLLGDGQDAAARQTRAAALNALGDHAGAAAEFDALGIADAALRAAILAGEWRRVEAMGAGPAAAAELGPLLGRAPGHAEVARAQAAAQAADPAEADSGAVASRSASEPAAPIAAVTETPASPPAAPTLAASPAPAPAVAALDATARGVDVPDAPAAAAAVLPDAGETFDRFGLVRRSSTLLAESERLRDALTPLLTGGN